MMLSWNQLVGFLTDWEGLRRLAACRSCLGFAASKPGGDGLGAGAVQSLAR